MFNKLFNKPFGKSGDQLAKEAINDYQKGKDEFEVVEKLEKALEVGIKHYPLDQIYLYIGAAFFDLSLYDKAKAAYERGLEYDKKNHSLLSNLGLTYSKLGDLSKAIPYYEASLEINPNNSYAYHNIGLFNYENGNHFKAIEYFDKAIERNPGLAVSYAVKSRCLSYVGRYEASNESYKNALKKGYDNGPVLRSDLEYIRSENGAFYWDPIKFDQLVARMDLPAEQVGMLASIQKDPVTFFENNLLLFEELTLTSFEMNCVLHWYLLIRFLEEHDRVLVIDTSFEPALLVQHVKTLLVANEMTLNDSLDEFEDLSGFDLEELVLLIAAKLKLIHSIELVNIWTSDSVLNIYPITGEKWTSLDYPFLDAENGYGKVFPLAPNQTIESIYGDAE
ncbi:MAG: tetratricopeptide repeat protein [Rhodothermales bacterium]